MTYAHTPGARGQWDDLPRHLRAVGDLAAGFAKWFGGGSLAQFAGLWHDLGKFTPEFQAYLKACAEGRPHHPAPHAHWGALLAYRLFKGQQQRWEEIVLPIAGHHSGLDDSGTLEQELQLKGREGQDVLANIQREVMAHNLLPPAFRTSLKLGSRRELFIRMVFSAVVDADYLDTEAHFHPERAGRRGSWPTLDELWQRLESAQERDFLRAENTSVNQVRAEVYQCCLKAAALPPGVFRLTVPTGGGKTRSGLAFALRHALIHGLRRVVVAIPYTSIIDQTAQVYRDTVGEDAVLEHHSQLEPPADEEQRDDVVRLRLASENWDAPLVVTTTVQLFDSLFSNRPSQVRKLHNLARSVLILDEVQTLPPKLLRPTLDVLRALVEEYGVSVVLSTATQPAFEGAPYLKEFADLGVHEIVQQHPQHFEVLKRVEYVRRSEPLSWADLAQELTGHHQAMVVLNTRRDALALLEGVGEEGDVFHLSTLLCGAHRRAVLTEIRERLRQQRSVRLISTQVVEAGVDLDFPVVYRAVGPLDRIVQAAGRCNREGRLPSLGKVVIFEPAEGGIPAGPYKVGLEKARLLLWEHPADALHSPELYKEYFRLLFSDVDLDEKKIQDYRRELNYPEVARRYRLIDEDTVPVVVPYGDWEARLGEWCQNPGRPAWQRLQPYLVSLHRSEEERLEREGWLAPVTPGPGLYHWLGQYDQRLGLRQALRDPSDLIV